VPVRGLVGSRRRAHAESTSGAIPFIRLFLKRKKKNSKYTSLVVKEGHKMGGRG